MKKYPSSNSYREIPLTQGKKTKVDPDIYDAYAWVGFRSDGRYVVKKVSTRAPAEFKTRSRMFLHNAIMRPPEGMVVDHINGDGYDNRRANLRICTPKQNSANLGMMSNNTSGYKGVHLFRSKGHTYWRAVIRCNDKLQSLGLFKNKHEAARAYNERALEIWGEFARPNVIQNTR